MAGMRDALRLEVSLRLTWLVFSLIWWRSFSNVRLGFALVSSVRSNLRWCLCQHNTHQPPVAMSDKINRHVDILEFETLLS